MGHQLLFLIVSSVIIQLNHIKLVNGQGAECNDISNGFGTEDAFALFVLNKRLHGFNGIKNNIVYEFHEKLKNDVPSFATTKKSLPNDLKVTAVVQVSDTKVIVFTRSE